MKEFYKMEAERLAKEEAKWIEKEAAGSERQDDKT